MGSVTPSASGLLPETKGGKTSFSQKDMLGGQATRVIPRDMQREPNLSDLQAVCHSLLRRFHDMEREQRKWRKELLAALQEVDRALDVQEPRTDT